MRKFIMVLKVAAMCAGIFSIEVVQAQPKLKGTDLLCNGESFFAAANICKELSRLARADGVLASGDFSQVAVSGVPIATVLNQFKSANPKPKYVVTDGGGIDLMSNNCKTGDTNCAVIQQLKNTMIQYIAEMKKSGVKAFLWMCYPDPQKNYAGALKTGQDIWAIEAKKVMDITTDPKPLWVDLRTTWAGHYDTYTGDGIHCTDAGGTATAQAFWNAMKANNYAFFDTTGGKVSTTGKPSCVASASPLLLGHVIGRDNITLSLSLTQPSNVTIRIATVSGRTVLTSQRHGLVAGLQTIQFPLGAVAPGVYCLEVQTGRLSERSSLYVR
jgi:hypothetical protein